MTDVNVQFRDEKLGQIAQARAIVEANQAALAEYDSGATQAALDAKLAADVAAGTIRMVGTDRYEVLEGWDRNEIFTVRRAVRPGEIPLILPESGLDFVDDKAQLYLAQPAWHELGNVIPGGISDVDSVLDLSGGNFTVSQRPVLYNFKGKRLTVDGSFVNVRSDTGAALGVVGGIYTPVQNRDGFAFLQELTGSGYAVWESAGPLRGGRKFFISMRLPEDVTVDAGGIDEKIRPYVVAVNSHDGTTPFQVVVTPWNPVCGNTERLAVEHAYTRWTVRHTKTALERIGEAQRTLRLSGEYFEQFAAEETRLARTKLLQVEFDELIASLWPVDADASDRAKGIASRRTEALREGFAKDSARVGQTAYAAERAVTDWLDHSAPRRMIGGSMAAARATAALEGSSDDLKSKAHKQLLTLAA